MADELDKSIIEAEKQLNSQGSESKQPIVSDEQQAAIDNEIQLEEKYGDSDILAGTLGAARGLSFGASDVLAKKSGLLSEEALREIEERNDTSSTIGEVGGIAAGALLTGSSSLAAKSLGAGIKTATKAGLAAEQLSARALQRLVAKEGKKKIVKDILTKSVAKSAGLTVEGAFYSTGHLISENALGRADFNAENVLSAAKEAVLFGTLIGTTAGTFSAIVPKIKNNRVVGWTKEKFKGKQPTNLNESAGYAIGKTNKELAKLKKHSPTEYNNLGKYVLEDLKFQIKDTSKRLYEKNNKVIKDASTELDSLFPELDGILKNGDELGLTFQGASNAEVASSMVDDLNKWVDDTLLMKNPNGQIVKRPGVSDSEVRSAFEEIENIRSIFGVNQAEKVLEKSKVLSAAKSDKINALNLKKYKLEQNIKLAEEFKNVPALKAKLLAKKSTKAKNIANTKKSILDKDKKILELKKSALKAKNKEQKSSIQAKIKKLQTSKQEARLSLRELNSKVETEINSISSKISQSPKVKEPKFFKEQLKSLNSEIQKIEKKFLKDVKPLNAEMKKFNNNAFSSVDASKIRRMRQDWSVKADWRKPYPELNSKAKMARAGYEILNNKISTLADLVEDVNSSISNKIRLANLKASTGLKLQKTLEAQSLKDLGIKEGAGKFLLGMAAKSSGLGGPIGFIMQSRGTYDVLRGLGEANLVHKMKLLSSVEKANKAVEKKVSGSVSNFFKKNISPTVKPIAFNTLLKSDLSKSVNEETLVIKKPKNKKEAFKNMTKNLAELLSDQESLIEKASQTYPGFQEAAPQTKQMITSNLVRMVQYLQEQIPKNSTFVQNNLIKREWVPSDLEISKFERVLEAVQNPLSVLEDLQNGTITRESAEALRVLKPQLYKQIQDKVMLEIQNSKETIPYQKRLLLGILLDLESDASLNGLNIAGLQGMHNEAQESQAGGSSAFKTDKIKADKLDIAESQMGGTEATAKRE